MAKYWNGTFGKGLKADNVDDRDVMFAPCKKQELPREATWKQFLREEPFDQGQLGSCTGQAAAGALIILLNRSDYKWKFVPSRTFIYYNARVIEGAVDQDAGAMIRSVFKAMGENGVCPEDSNPRWSWPYDVEKFAEKPSDACYENAKSFHLLVEYKRVVLHRDHLRSALVEGPVVFGLQLKESFESDKVARTGEVPMPKSKERSLGGHAMLAYGYDRKNVHVRNSWGSGWGDGGNCYIPFDVIEQYGADAWQPVLLGTKG